MGLLDNFRKSDEEIIEETLAKNNIFDNENIIQQKNTGYFDK